MMMSAANEKGVEGFLAGTIEYLEIVPLVEAKFRAHQVLCRFAAIKSEAQVFVDTVCDDDGGQGWRHGNGSD